MIEDGVCVYSRSKTAGHTGNATTPLVTTLKTSAHPEPQVRQLLTEVGTVTMSSPIEIFVGLPGEAVDMWRPVQAERVHDDVYKITDQSYDRDVERWQFEPGDEVVCELIESSEGRILAATRRAD